MTVRPETYGDQYPSDEGDVPPGSPVEGFQERDYRVRGHRSKGIPVRPNVMGTPDMRQENEFPEPRPVFAAVIISRIDDHKYIVLRQDGRRGFAYTRATDDIYERLPPGEQVALIAAMEPGTWLIVGSQRRKEMASKRVVNSQSVLTNMAERQIIFDELVSETAEDLKEIELFGGGIRAKNPHSAQYEISVMVHVEHMNPATQDSYIGTENDCIGQVNQVPITGIQQTNRLNFFPDSGFYLYWDQVQCRTTVVIQPQESNFMLHSGPGGGPARWTDAPVLANSIEVGTHVPKGWVKIRGNATGGLWLGHGDGITLKVLFPDSSPSTFGQGFKGQHPYADKHNGDSVKLEWTKPGVTGACSFSYDGGTFEIEVDKGIVIKMTGAQNESNVGLPLQNAVPAKYKKTCPF